MTIQIEFKKTFGKRKPASHKGDYGRILILAGSRGLTGAAYLTAMAALRSGAGLVTLACPETIYSILARRAAEVMVRPFPATREGTFAIRGKKPIQKFLITQHVLALGPGLSKNRETQRLIRELALSSPVPIVIDADGLNAFQRKTALLRKFRSDAILTPHLGEFARLFGRKPLKEAARLEAARKEAQRFKIVLVLKGHHTVVASPDGGVHVNRTGNPGMATGGTGDVLTGVIAAFLGRGLSPFDAARFAVYIHGLAGDLAAREAGQNSLIAGDLLNFLPQAFKKLLR